MIIQIGQTLWSVVESADIEDFGKTDSMGARIVVRADQNVDQKRDTILHEVLHAICFHYGVPTGGDEAEEAILKTLTPALLDVLNRNPTLVRTLIREN